MRKKNLLLLFICLLVLTQTSLHAQCDDDTVAPIAVCSDMLTVEISSLTQEAVITTDDVDEGSNDNCSTELDFRLSLTGVHTEPPATTTVTITEAGVHYITLWVIDEAGNWNRCWSQVFAHDECEDDTEPPVAVCESGSIFQLEGTFPIVNVSATQIDDGSFDLCSPIVDYRISFFDNGEPPATTSVSIEVSGEFQVYLWVMDEAGNWSSCETTIIVVEGTDNCDNDLMPPLAICQETVTINAGESLSAQEIDEGSFDMCSDSIDYRISLAGNETEPPSTTSLDFPLPGNYQVVLWVIDEAGNWNTCWTDLTVIDNGPTQRISGFAFIDEDADCQHDPEEAFLEGWTVEITPFIDGVADGSNSVSIVNAQTDASGYYFADLSQSYVDFYDSVEVRLVTSLNIAQNCPLTYVISTDVFDDDDEIFKDFAVTLEESCYLLEVDIAAPFLRRCFPSTYQVSYCNYGALTATDAYVEVVLDSFLLYFGSTITPTAISGNTYTFPIGDIAPGACGQFAIIVDVSCDALLGQTHCSSAQIFPNEPCDGPYLGAEIEVVGSCDEAAEEVVFTLTNIGEADMSEAKNYLVVEDVIMYMNEPFQLEVGGQIEVGIPANGATFRLEAEQPDTYPWSFVTSATVEGCGQNEDGGVTLGMVTAFSPNDNMPFFAIDCQENIGSYDPNDKQALPRGVGEENLLRKNIPLDYKIRFQNTGTDTAFNVVVLDTLSEWLDISAVRPGVSSHTYSFQIHEDRVLEFRFSNIHLPDSTTNEPASNGFVQFSVQQLPDNPDGTIIENNAAIYFDYNEPVITNTVFHTIGEVFVTVDTDEASFDSPALKVYPNPFAGQATFELPESIEGNFTIYNMQGQVVHQASVSGKRFQLHRQDLPGTGVFAYELIGQNGVVYRGKIVTQL